MPVLAEGTLIAASKTDELDKSKVAELADNFNSMAKVEELLEDDYNSIDGIINNGSKEDMGYDTAGIIMESKAEIGY